MNDGVAARLLKALYIRLRTRRKFDLAQELILTGRDLNLAEQEIKDIVCEIVEDAVKDADSSEPQITRGEKDVLNFVRTYFDDYQRYPKGKEIAEGVGLGSLQISRYIARLRGKKLLGRWRRGQTLLRGGLTMKQKLILRYVADYQAQNNQPLTYGQIAENFGITRQMVGLHMRSLELKGWLKTSHFPRKRIVILKCLEEKSSDVERGRRE